MSASGLLLVYLAEVGVKNDSSELILFNIIGHLFQRAIRVHSASAISKTLKLPAHLSRPR